MILQNDHIHKIGIFRALQLGDMLCHIPAMRALRTAFPHAEITLFGLPWCAAFTERFNGYFDRFIHFPGFPGLPEQVFDEQAYLHFQSRVRSEQFDLLIQMQGNGTIVNQMMNSWHGRQLAGFCNVPDEGETMFMLYPDGIHEIDRHLRLLQHLGIPSRGRQLEFPLFPADLAEVEALNLSLEEGRYVCIHPGSRGSYRQWSPANFTAAANLCHEYGLQIVFTGTSDERHIIDQVVSTISYPFVNLCGLTSLGAVAAIIRNAAMLISNCTGVSHIAAALETPSVVISMDAEPERWGPLNRNLHRTIDCQHSEELGKVLLEVIRLIKSLQLA